MTTATPDRDVELLGLIAELTDSVTDTVSLCRALVAARHAAGLPVFAAGPAPWFGMRYQLEALAAEGLVEVDTDECKPDQPRARVRIRLTGDGQRVARPMNSA